MSNYFHNQIKLCIKSLSCDVQQLFRTQKTKDSRPRVITATEGLCGPQVETNILTSHNMNLNAQDFGHMDVLK